MKIKSFVLGAALLSAAGLSTPALAYTHHPATSTERKQTEDLNAQQLAQAQQPANASMSASDQQNNAMTNTSSPTMAPADQQNQDSTKPAQPGDQNQNMQTPQAQTPPPSPQQ